MKKLLLLAALTMLLSCTKETTEPLIEVTYKVTGDRLFYDLTVSDSNGEATIYPRLKNTNSITINVVSGSDIFMQVFSRGYGDYEIELLIDGDRADYFKGYLEDTDVVFLND